MTDRNETNFFLEQREDLRNWPYTIHQLNDTLDMNLIEGRGKQLLFQGINTKRLTGFVGSGISMAYGRMTWNDWKNRQLGAVGDLANAFNKLANQALKRIEQVNESLAYFAEMDEAKETEEKQPGSLRPSKKAEIDNLEKSIQLNPKCKNERHSISGWLKNRERAIRFAQMEVSKLHRLFEHAKDDEGDFPGGEDAPIEFQIAEQLHIVLRQYVPLFVDFNEKPHLEIADSFVENSFGLVKIGAFVSSTNGAPEIAIRNFEATIKSWPLAPSALKSLKKTYHSKRNGYAKAFIKFYRIASKPDSRKSMEDMAKSLLVDECAHAEHILVEGLRHPNEIKTPTSPNPKYQRERDKLRQKLALHDSRKFSRSIPGIRQDPDRYQVLSYFTFEKIISEIKRLVSSSFIVDHPQWKTELENLITDLTDSQTEPSEPNPNVRRYVLSPTSRFLVGVVLRLSNGDKPEMLSGDLQRINATSFTSRRSIVAKKLDPIPKLVDGLNIHRFMTLNYDFEIERYFQDIGFRKFAVDESDERTPSMGRLAQNDLRYDGVGAALRDLTFERDAASDLISFTSGRDGATYGVYHLHGRATQSGKLVVNERDYMDLYLQEDENRETVDEAISMAFASNPLVFLGLGMNEADLLRPLRQFASNRDHNTGYNAIALVPAEHGFARRAKFSSGLYIRYGVHTVFYGSGVVKVKDDKGKVVPCSIDWLHRILKLTRTLATLTKEHLNKGIATAGLDEKFRPENSDPTEWMLKHLEGTTGVLGQDLVQDQHNLTAEQSTLPILLGRKILAIKDLIPSNLFNLQIASPLFSSARRQTSSSREHLDGAPYLEFYLKRLTAILHMTLLDVTNLKTPAQRTDLSARLAMLDGIYGAIITGSLNAALDGLQKEHQEWWQDWQQCPPYRAARFERLGLAEKKNENDFFMPRRHVRHRIHNTITALEKAEKELAQPIDNGPIPEWVHKPGRFDNPSRTGVRTHDTFIAAVANERLRRHKKAQDNGRRLYTIAAHRGLGKGSLMSAMATRKGLSGYIYSAWDHEQKPPMFTDAIFVNFSFSSEIASAYDMIDDALLASIAGLQMYADICAPYVEARVAELKIVGPFVNGYEEQCKKRYEKEIKDKGAFLQKFLNKQRWSILNYPQELKKKQTELEEWKRSRPDPAPKELNYRIDYLKFVVAIMDRKDQISAKNSRLPRLDRLRVLASLYSEESARVANFPDGRQPRVFMFLSAIDILFTNDRLAKNKEVEGLITLLTSASSKRLPFDIIFIGDETRLGWPWITPLHDQARLSLLSENNTPAELVRIDRQELPETAHIAINARIKNSQLELSNKVGDERLRPERTNFVHIARVVNPVNLLIDSFTPLAICLHIGAFYRDAYLRNGDHDTEPKLKAYAMWEGDGPSIDLSASLSGEAEKITLEEFNNQPSKEIVLPLTDDPISEEDMKHLLKGANALSIKMVSTCRNYLNRVCSTVPPTDETLKKTGREDQEWKEIVVDVKNGSNDLDKIGDLLRLRFRVQGNLDFQEWRVIRRTLGANRFSLTILLAAAQTLALREPQIVKGAQQAERFILEVVDKVRTGSRAKRESLVLSSVLEVYRNLHVLAEPDHDYELHQLLLRHLAAIGAPTTVGVLVRLPEVRRYLTTLGQELPYSRTKFIGRAMHRLCMRGIVFRLSRHPRLQELQMLKKSDSDRPQFRYALHRSVQRHVMTHFGTMSTDVARANEFSPSLFASMPSGLPRLNYASYQFLRELMLSLSQYPDIPLHVQDGEEWNFSSARRTTQVQALRAALSMVRSSFSVAVVSRFEDYKDIKDDEVRKRGYFETYKVHLRWIIRKAWSLNRDMKNRDHRFYRPDREWNQVNALYRDEVVWLYNEVGLVCLVQGNLHDALGHLRQAGELNQNIEGREEDGAMGHRISINRAICQMERGHIQAARRRLADVRNDERARNKGKIFYLATAHLGVCDHLLGKHESAKDKLEKALDYLLARNDIRAAAVIGHHLARLYFITDLDQARQQLLTARRFAEAGGHEDIRRHIDISDVALTIDHMSSSSNTDGQHIEGSKKLLAVIDYARLMGVPALECEALIVRGRILLTQNESTAAGAVLTRAMTLAKRNGMNLRLNRAMTLYGDVLLRRGQLHAAERLLFESLEKAKNSQFRSEVTRIQRLLDRLRSMHSAV